ncbi:MAG: 50S ribosomal protein L18Ae [Candidatus Jordarchaeales archaeon]|nr:50S ribosomal protein L18a [Candidatus Jordarchaeia archaeon]
MGRGDDVKVFRIEGYYAKKRKKIFFSEEVRSLSKEHALELVYSNIGSRHRVKRRDVIIKQINVISPEEAKSVIVRTLSGLEM